MRGSHFRTAGDSALSLAILLLPLRDGSDRARVDQQLRTVGPGHGKERDLRRFGLMDPLLDFLEALQNDHGVVLAEADIGRHYAYPIRSSTGISRICGGCRWSQRIPRGRSYWRSTSIT